MDKVRLGRALGYGTRHAAKTLAAVAEAATAPAPGAANASQEAPPNAPSSAPIFPQPQPSARLAHRARAGLPLGQVRNASRSFWGPLATFSGALWLRVTGLFFAVVALAMARGAWQLRGIFRSVSNLPAASTQHFWVFAGFALLFGYFAVSSFLRASLLERRAVRRSSL